MGEDGVFVDVVEEEDRFVASREEDFVDVREKWLRDDGEGEEGIFMISYSYQRVFIFMFFYFSFFVIILLFIRYLKTPS